MAPLSASTLMIGSTSLTNLSSSRHRPPSLEIQRKVGWTEVWGNKDRSIDKNKSDGNTGNDGDNGNDEDDDGNKAIPPRYVTVMKDGSDYIDGENKSCDASSSSSAAGKTATNNVPSSSSSSSMVKLTQHRVAWLEQIVLRMNYIPHIVENSGYAAAESTGGLPCLMDPSSSHQHRQHDDGGKDASGRYSSTKGDDDDDDDNDVVTKWGRAWKESLTQLDKPVLIGRNQPGGMGSNFFRHPHVRNTNRNGKTTSSTSTDFHPSWFLPSGSHIVDYLRMKYSHVMKDNLRFQEHLRGGSPSSSSSSPSSSSSGDAMAYETLIRDKLNYILLALRYGHDPAWEGVYRPQCIRATMDPHGVHQVSAASDDSGSQRKSFFPLFAWYQTYSERALALHNLLPSTHAMSPSIHGGLALELFRYNDYRCPDASESSQSEEEDDDDDSTEEADVHQHHPFSSFVPSYGGVGGGDSGKVNVHRAMEFANIYYASLEEKLLASSHSDDGVALVGNDASKQTTYFLGTKKPTYIDALLFAHLAEALCDVHLILVLAKHSRLMKYFQRMYDQYFGEAYATAWKLHSAGGREADKSVDWVQKNNVVNALNAFNQIPEANSLKPVSKGAAPSMDDEGREMIHAIQLMQQIAVHCHDLEEALRDAAALRAAGGGENALLKSYQRPVGSRLYRWIMGGDVKFWWSSQRADKSSDADGVDDDASSQSDDVDRKGAASEEEVNKQRSLRERMKEMKRERQTQDELWLSGVVVTVVAAFIISASGTTKK